MHNSEYEIMKNLNKNIKTMDIPDFLKSSFLEVFDYKLVNYSNTKIIFINFLKKKTKNYNINNKFLKSKKLNQILI